MAYPRRGGRSSGQGTAVARVDRKDVMTQLEQGKDKLAKLLLDQMDPEAFLGGVAIALQKNPTLLECETASLVNAVFQAAQAGLRVGGVVPHGHLVPFRDQVQFIPDYRGLIYLAVQAGAIRSGEARLVYRGEHFAVHYGTSPQIEHDPDWTKVDQGPDAVVAAYFVAYLPAGGVQFEVMTRDQLDGIRERSKAKDKGPWVSDTEEMFRKTVVKRGIKYVAIGADLPGRERLATAIQADNEALGFPEDDDDVGDVTAAATRRRVDDLRERIGRDVTDVQREEEEDYEDLSPRQQYEALIAKRGWKTRERQAWQQKYMPASPNSDEWDDAELDYAVGLLERQENEVPTTGRGMPV